MKNPSVGTRAILSAAALTAAIASGVSAQTAPPAIPPPQPTADPITWQFLPVQNVSPAMVAWWIDPDHNPGPAVPPDILSAYESHSAPASEQMGFVSRIPPVRTSPTAAPAKHAGAFSARGIEVLIPSLQKHGVLAYGTAAGMQQLRTILNYLDKPAQYVEINTKIIELNHEDVAGFGVNSNNSNAPFSFSTVGLNPATTTGAVSTGYSRNNWQAQLETLLAAHKAKVLADSSMMTVNNRTADTDSSYSAVEPGAQGGYPGYVTVKDSLALTPTVNNDGTITMVIGIKHTKLTYNDTTGPEVLNTSQIMTTANVKDGDTVALGGLRGTGAANAPAKAADRDLLVFIVAHIVKPQP